MASLGLSASSLFQNPKDLPSPPPADLATVLPRLASLRVHESEAQAWLLLLCIRTQPALFDELLNNLQQRAELLAQACTDNSLLPHGLMACLRFAIEEGAVEASLPRMQQLTTALLAVARQSSELLSKFTGTDCRGHVLDSEHVTLGMWLACKENGLLLAQYSEWMTISPQIGLTVKKLATDFFQVLLALKHRGSIVKTANGLTAYFQRLFKEQLTTELPLQLLRQLLDVIRSSEDKAQVLRRSAGFPQALVAILQSAPKTAFTASFTELLALTDTQQQSEVRIHALNILRYVLQDKTLKTKSERYLGPCLQAGALALNSEDGVYVTAEPSPSLQYWPRPWASSSNSHSLTCRLDAPVWSWTLLRSCRHKRIPTLYFYCCSALRLMALVVLDSSLQCCATSPFLTKWCAELHLKPCVRFSPTSQCKQMACSLTVYQCPINLTTSTACTAKSSFSSLMRTS